MSNGKNRNEVNLSDEVLRVLQELADKDGRSLKNYMEKVLTKHAERTKKDSK
jgi:predicted transcriptional regulator